MKAVTITSLLLYPMAQAYCRRGHKYCGNVLKYIRASPEVLEYYNRQIAAQKDGFNTLFGCNFANVVPLLHCQLSSNVKECDSYGP
ncbi:hypothetical protein CDD80_4382 [Ophiocordyceps camponoti-rufipedis]|uniref:Uncharacterized protein n=1 Tax=Ophiocordyceps camponoti-rufipedis TaxID=2004952 RepID=A0A2C5YV78_9HYPO|nr:hypothetical protein CDD80_4382 [Ophiocordyceps camponoti-rufipedis]